MVGKRAAAQVAHACQLTSEIIVNGIELVHRFPDKFRAAKCFSSAVSDLERGASRVVDLEARQNDKKEKKK